MQIAKHTVVSINYTLTNAAGDIIDSSEGQEPLTYMQGMHNIIPGLEDALEGKAKGDALKVTIPPAEAYGERIDSLSRQVPSSAFDGAGELQVGMQFRAQSEDQREVLFTIVAIDGDTVTIDGNHPLAGETLNFDVEVMDVRSATAEELDHGHVHGPGGHHH